MAYRGTLPEDFNLWSLTDDRGLPIAHVAAKYGHLPADFDQWGIASPTGDTVAHIAARNDHLPEDFNRWGMTDGWGVTVREAFDYLRVPRVKLKRGNEK